MSTEERLDRLERQNRLLKGGVGLTLLAVVAGGLLIFAVLGSVPEVIEARAFHVVTDDGRVLVKLEGMIYDDDTGGGTVTTLNSQGYPTVELGAGPLGGDGSGEVSVLNDQGEEVVRLWALTNEGVITTLNGEGDTLVELGMNDAGDGSITTQSHEEQLRVKEGLPGEYRDLRRRIEAFQASEILDDPASTPTQRRQAAAALAQAALTNARSKDAIEAVLSAKKILDDPTATQEQRSQAAEALYKAGQIMPEPK